MRINLDRKNAIIKFYRKGLSIDDLVALTGMKRASILSILNGSGDCIYGIELRTRTSSI